MIFVPPSFFLVNLFPWRLVTILYGYIIIYPYSRLTYYFVKTFCMPSTLVHLSGNISSLLCLPVIHDDGYIIVDFGFWSGPRIAPHVLNVEADIHAPAKHSDMRYRVFTSSSISSGLSNQRIFGDFHPCCLHHAISSDTMYISVTPGALSSEARPLL